MLRHSFEPLEGSNILWHIVAPPPPSQPNFSLSFLNFAPDLVACLFGWMFDSTRRSRGMALYETYIKECFVTILEVLKIKRH